MTASGTGVSGRAGETTWAPPQCQMRELDVAAPALMFVVVTADVLRPREHGQIAQAVVVFDMILVVDVLRRTQSAPEFALHLEAMFEHVCVQPYEDVHITVLHVATTAPTGIALTGLIQALSAAGATAIHAAPPQGLTADEAFPVGISARHS